MHVPICGAINAVYMYVWSCISLHPSSGTPHAAAQLPFSLRETVAARSKLIFGVMLQFNVVWCIHSRREIVLTIQSDNGKQGYKVGRKKYRRPKVVLSQRPLRTV